MIKNQNSDNILRLDLEIAKLQSELDNVEGEQYDKLLEKLESVVNLRVVLAESKTKTSILPSVISGIAQVGSLLLVLHFEKADAVTSKAFNMLKLRG